VKIIPSSGIQVIKVLHFQLGEPILLQQGTQQMCEILSPL